MNYARSRRLLAAQMVDDLLPGDFVRRPGHRGTGMVESVSSDGYATVAWSKDRRDILPFAALRRVKQCGEHLDSRG